MSRLIQKAAIARKITRFYLKLWAQRLKSQRQNISLVYSLRYTITADTRSLLGVFCAVLIF